jgi:hypothetical protein
MWFCRLTPFVTRRAAPDPRLSICMMPSRCGRAGEVTASAGCWNVLVVTGSAAEEAAGFIAFSRIGLPPHAPKLRNSLCPDGLVQSVFR